jgi:hypothetical protein
LYVAGLEEGQHLVMRALLGAYRLALRLYPLGFRQSFGEEMVAVFEQQVKAVAAQGSGAQLLVLLRELASLLVEGLRERWRARLARPVRVVELAGPTAGMALAGAASRAGWVLWFVLLIPGAASVCFVAYLFGGYMIFESPPRVHQVALADLNGNGHLDAYLAVGPSGSSSRLFPDSVLFGDGTGRFLHSGQRVGVYNSFAVALGDVDGDGHVDAVEGNYIYLNNGSGTFRMAGNTSTWPRQGAFRVTSALADLNGDGRLDIYGAACCGGGILTPEGVRMQSPDLVALNTASGQFRLSGGNLSRMGNHAVALGDLDGNGTIDAFIASGLSTQADGRTARKTPNSVWLNDGRGNFTDSGQALGNEESLAVALGDLNGNGFLDAVVGNRGRDEIWFNDGTGRFTASGQRLNIGQTRSVHLADLNGDGHLDLFTAGNKGGRAWLNDGTGRFTPGQSIRFSDDSAVALGDLNGNGVIDVLAAGVEAYRVWLGQGDGRFSARPRTAHSPEWATR